MKECITIHIGNLTIELTNEIVKVNDNIVELLCHEYKLLSMLARANINSWVSVEDIQKELDLFNICNWLNSTQEKLSKHKSTVNIIESLTGEYVKLGSYLEYQSPCILKSTEFDESSKEIQEKEELIDELRYQIRRDMEDYKLLCSDKYGNEDIPLFGDEEHYRFLRIYLRDNIKNNIQKLRDINKC